VTTTRSFSTAGIHTVKLTVTDEDGGVGEATVQVSVQTVAQALSSIIAAVQNLTGLNQGQKNSLIAKLNAASDSATRGDTTAANNQLNAFLNELQADVNTGRISSADATTLRAAVNAIKAAMGTYNRFLSWWPLSA
jgi:PKD repeat protein